MRTAVAAALGGLMLAAPAAAADYAVIRQDIVVERSADHVWARVGANYCGLGEWLKVKCVYTSGSGDVGTMRRIADRIDEVMVAKTPHSYTYAQPTSAILYHGTLGVEPIDKKRSRIVYTLFYDQEPLGTAEARLADRTRRAATFKTALATMKAMAEAR